MTSLRAGQLTKRLEHTREDIWYLSNRLGACMFLSAVAWAERSTLEARRRERLRNGSSAGLLSSVDERLLQGSSTVSCNCGDVREDCFAGMWLFSGDVWKTALSSRILARLLPRILPLQDSLTVAGNVESSGEVVVVLELSPSLPPSPSSLEREKE